MAKEGIDSFLLDCHTNDNIAEIEAEFGVKGFAIIVRLWQKIYSEKGYYCEWIERSPLLFLAQWFGGNSGVDLNLINTVVSRAIKIGIFSEPMFKDYAILTSEGIQKRYFDVVKRRTEVKVENRYLLVSDVNFNGNVNKNVENVCRNEKNVCRNETSKVNRTKVNRTKVKECVEEHNSKPTHTPLKEEDYVRLCDKYSQSLVDTYIERTSSYKCCNAHTIEKWINEDIENEYTRKEHFKEMRAKKNTFNNFPQRNYTKEEFNEIERKLLQKGLS